MTNPTLTYGEQTLRYFSRPHDAMPSGPVGGPAAWRGGDLDRSDWHETLEADEVAEIERATTTLLARGPSITDAPVDAFPLPTMQPRVDRWRAELRAGRGFVLVSGFAVDPSRPERAEAMFWGLGLHLGQPGFQDVVGRPLGHIIDEGVDEPGVRSYRTNRNIRYHCDAADVVGLLCLGASSAGGLSRLASSVTVFDVMSQVRPDLVSRLFAPFALDTRSDGIGAGHVPIQPCCFSDGALRTFFHSDYFRSAARHADVELTAFDLEVLDVYEEIAERPDIRLDMELATGDVQLVSNHTVIHARTGYDDDVARGARRHLLRLWLSLES